MSTKKRLIYQNHTNLMIQTAFVAVCSKKPVTFQNLRNFTEKAIIFQNHINFTEKAIKLNHRNLTEKIKQ
jgi:hypothetical protein